MGLLQALVDEGVVPLACTILLTFRLEMIAHVRRIRCLLSQQGALVLVARRTFDGIHIILYFITARHVLRPLILRVHLKRGHLVNRRRVPCLLDGALGLAS